MTKTFLPLNLQLFAEGGAAGGSGTGAGGGTGQPAAGGASAGAAGASPGNQGSGQGNAAAGFDYDRLASLIQGKQTVAEDAVLKNYFKQQGLSQDEAKQAIAAFKAEKAKNQPDVGALQSELTQAQKAAQEALLQSAATMAAVSLGIDAKTIPYVLKMADLSTVAGQDGKINEEALKNALNKVLEDIPALKPQAKGSAGFVRVGAAGSSGQTGKGTDGPVSLKDAVSEALKK